MVTMLVANPSIMSHYDDIIIEIMCFADVPTLVRIKVVCSTWKTLAAKAIDYKLPPTGRKQFTESIELYRAVRKYPIEANAEKLARVYGWPIGKWDVSGITDFSNIFRNQRSFNEDIRRWNTSNAIRMNSMFSGASSFNMDISIWDTSKVKNMRQMFFLALSFNQDISSWDISKVQSMESMFHGASSFIKDLSSWDISKVDNVADMFLGVQN
mmetsp:Transcript_12704/g.18679  ORF Transcript_12704/g.18679 Transcript_12704/m.18679 type:complete len:212 (+) Transcript_12704:76-711(+)